MRRSRKPHLYILAGGRSSRFGSDKARAVVNGKPAIACLVHALAHESSSVTVVARQEGMYDDLQLRTIADRMAGCGPLAGVDAALNDAPRDSWTLIVSCDFLAARRTWVRRLLDARRANSLAVAFRHERWEPLLALYHTNLREEVEHRLHTGRHALWSLLEDINATGVEPPSDWPEALQFNTKEELGRFVTEQMELSHG